MFLRRDKLSLYHKVKKPMLRGKGYRRSWHYLVWRVKRLQGSPSFIARGLAIGVGISFWPILFTHLILGYVICRMTRASVIAMAIGTLVGNPWTFAIVYPLMYRIGKVLLGFHVFHPVHSAEVAQSIEAIWHQIWPIHSWQSFTVVFQELLLPMMIGGFLLGLPCVLLTYHVVRRALATYQEKRRERLLEAFHRVEQDIETDHSNKGQHV